MGSVLSILYNPSLYDAHVLRLGVAVAAAASFCPFQRWYPAGLAAVLPASEPSAAAPCADARAALADLCNEAPDRGLDTPPARPRRCLAIPTCERERAWRSRTAESKKLHQAAAVQAQRAALRYARRYRLYGPPDWTDPALSLLPSLCVPGPGPSVTVLLSPFPFAAPHIVLSPPADDDSADHLVARANGVPRQDQAFGNRLVVGDPPSQSGPRAVIFNAAPPRKPAAAAKSAEARDSATDVPPLTDDEGDADDASSYEPSECGDVLSASPQEVSSRKDLGTVRTPVLWIEEDEEDLPDLPASWLT